MSNVIPAVASPRARADTPVIAQPDRRPAEASGSDFARSLASVRGLERSASNQDRAALARRTARRDDRTNDRDDMRSAADQLPTVRSRAQMQALMLSGAMKFAATRGTDTALAPADTKTPTISTEPSTSVKLTDNTLMSLPDAPADVTTAIIATPIAAARDDAPLVDVTESEADTAAAAMSVAATLAAMQLVAALPLPDAAPEMNEQSGEETATSGGKSTGEGMHTVWNRRLATMPTTQDDSVLVEDHFDAPATAAGGTSVTDAMTTLPTTPTTTPVATSAVRREPTATGERTTTNAPTPVGASATTTIRRSGSNEVEHDVTQLTPEFRERLQRVMDRMRREFGHEVTIVETMRSPERQAALFAQGRTAPGPVVTWTRNSKHSQGLAADLMVDGQWENPLGYAHLHQVAKQEGLRTLGARDPGHVELATNGSVSAETLGALLDDLGGHAADSARKARADVHLAAREDASAALARVADVAQVARVSSVAQVARVATVARPGAAPARAESGGGEAISPLAMSGPMPAFMMEGAAATRLASPVGNVNMADRISQLMDLQASQASKPLNSVLLRMDNASGMEDQIRIDMRGTSVDAQLGLGSAQQAADLGSRVSELRDALERRGLTADGLRIQAAPRTTDSVNFSRTTVPAIEVAALRAAAESQTQGGPRDQASRDQQHREAMAREQQRPTPRPSSDDARHRSRREQPETRQ